MKLLSHDALVIARQVYGRIRVAHGMVRIGQEDKARAVLDELASIVEAEIPVLDGVIAAQAKAAEACDLTQWTPAGPIPVRRKPAPHPTAANENHASTPEKPGGSVA